eukprot:scaffold83396_cov28-Tisochrysis_lutea.AAC.6
MPLSWQRRSAEVVAANRRRPLEVPTCLGQRRQVGLDAARLGASPTRRGPHEAAPRLRRRQLRRRHRSLQQRARAFGCPSRQLSLRARNRAWKVAAGRVVPHCAPDARRRLPM